MTNKKRILTDYAIPPGVTLAEELEYRGMTQKELAIRLGMSPKTINQIIKGEAHITPETAIGLENVLGIDAIFWLNLEANYQEDIARLKTAPKDKEIEIAKRFPYSDIAKLKYVPTTKRPDERVLYLRKFLGVSSLEQVDQLPLVSNFRRKITKNSSFYALLTWLRLAEIAAQEQLESLSIFSRQTIADSFDALRALTYCEDGFAEKIQNICAKAGIAVVFIPNIKGTSIQGATKWLTPEKALIAVTLRYKWADVFWFSLFHEIGHLYLKNQSKKITFIDFENDQCDDERIEQAADTFAANILIPENYYRKFVKKGNFSEQAVNKFASDIRIAPHIVWGRLAKNGYVPWSEVKNYRIKLDFSNFAGAMAGGAYFVQEYRRHGGSD